MSLNDQLMVYHEVDLTSLCLYDVPQYTIRIQNISNEYVKDIFVQDILSDNLDFIENTLTINDQICRTYNYLWGISVGNLAPKQSITLKFKAVANNMIKGFLCSQAVAEYANTHYLRGTAVRAVAKSNQVMSSVVNRPIVHLCRLTSLLVPARAFKFAEFIRASISNLEGKLLFNDEGLSLLIHAMINYEVKLTGKYKRTLSYHEGISCLMEVPSGLSYMCNHKLDSQIEYYEVVNRNVKNKINVALWFTIFL